MDASDAGADRANVAAVDFPEQMFWERCCSHVMASGASNGGDHYTAPLLVNVAAIPW